MVALAILGTVAACDDDDDDRRAECTTEADSDVDCVPRNNSVGHVYFYNGTYYSCAWYNHSVAPRTTYVPVPSAAYAAHASAARAAMSARGGFGTAAAAGGGS